MKDNSKCQLCEDAPLSLCALIGSEAVLTVQRHVMGVVFVQHDWTNSEHILDEGHVRELTDQEAIVQAQAYGRCIQEYREHARRQIGEREG